ncbi:hypothetical protein [Paenibacillus sp. NPDC057967]|uniref:hypothetical protein n=1 Tax=Paenibacillus sp. NPDC057967 TaxID=3346293 RepID=UPI0036D9BAA9
MKRRLNRTEYATCQQALAEHTETLWLRFADREISEGTFARLDTKLTEWEAELERKRPVRLWRERTRPSVGVG